MPSAPFSTRFRKSPCFGMVLAALAVSGLALLLYLPVGHFSFLHFDDGYYVHDNPFVPFGFSWFGLRQAFALSGQYTYWHPLTWLSLMFDAQFFGLDPGAFHLHNAILHALSAGLLGLALAIMTGRIRESMLVALIFAVHPMNIESVAWVTERKSVLSTLFWMLALLAYAAHARRPSVVRLGMVALALALGLLAKPTLVVLPVVLLLLDWWPLARFANAPAPEPGEKGESRFPRVPARRLLLEKVPFFVLSAAAAAMVLASRQDVSMGSEVSDPVSLGLRLANIPVSILKYMVKFFLPQDLTIFYPFPLGIPAWQWGGALVLLAALTIAILAAARRVPVLAVGWLWFLVCLAPMSGVVQTGLWPELADRFIYLPMIGLALILGMGARGLVPRWGPHGHLVPMAALAVYFAFFTWLQLPYWRDGQALFTRAAELVTDSSVISNNLAKAKLREGNVEGALEQLSESARLNPQSLWPHLFRGRVLGRMGLWDEAEKEYRQGLKDRPGEPNLLLSLAMSLAARGRNAAAEARLQEALAKEPDDLGLLTEYGKLLLREKRFAQAEEVLRKLLRRMPRDLNLRSWLAQALVGEGRPEEAMNLVREVLHDDRGFVPALRVAVTVHRIRGETAEAQQVETEARAVEDHYARAFAEIGKEALAAGKTASAVYHALQAVQLAPWSEEYSDVLVSSLRAAGRGGEVQDVLTMARGAENELAGGIRLP